MFKARRGGPAEADSQCSRLTIEFLFWSRSRRSTFGWIGPPANVAGNFAVLRHIRAAELGRHRQREIHARGDTTAGDDVAACR